MPRVEHGVHRAGTQRQQPVQKLRHVGDGAHVQLPVRVEDPDAHLLLDQARRHAGRGGAALAAVEVHEPVVQARPRQRRLEVELGREQPLARRLPLALRERAELVESPRDRAQEAALRLEVRRDEHELGRARLVRPVDAAHALHAPRAAPSRLDAVEHAALLILGCEIRVVAAARSAGLAEDEHPATACHELVRLGVARPPRAALLDGLVDAVDLALGEAPRAPGHLGDGVRAEVGHDLVEHAVRHAYRTDVEHQPVPSADGLRRLHELARRVLDGA